MASRPDAAEWGTSAFSRARQRGQAREALQGALVAAGGSVSRAAKMLGVHRSYLYAVAASQGWDLSAMALDARNAAATPRTA